MTPMVPLAMSAVIREPRVTLVARPHFVPPPDRPLHTVAEASDGEQLSEYAGRLRSASLRNPAERPTAEYFETLSGIDRDRAFGHASYSLLCAGVSRVFAHELMVAVPSLTASYPSFLLPDEGSMQFVLPPALHDDATLEATWRADMADALDRYRTTVLALMTRHAWINDTVQRRQIARDAAQCLLPGATSTTLLCTGSVRSWRLVVEQCGHERAGLEGRRLSVAILALLHAEAPALFGDCVVYTASDRHSAVRGVRSIG